VRGEWVVLLAASCFLSNSTLSHATEPSARYIRRNAIRIPRLGYLPAAVHRQIESFRVIMIGETHGTRELPQVPLSVIRSLRRQGKSVALGLEIPRSAQPDIDRFLKSGNMEELKRSKFFSEDVRDGRNSEAMARLLSTLRKTPEVKVICFDIDLAASAQARDSAMARHLYNEFTQSKMDALVVYAGSVHSANEVGVPWDPEFRPMGYEFSHHVGARVLSSEVFAIRLRYMNISAWVGMGDPEVIYRTFHFPPQMTAYSRAAPFQKYFLKEPIGHEGYQGTFYIETVTASEPLVPQCTGSQWAQQRD
jgi:hypothetical protein